ncbi:MAG: deoxyribodipyrimidine photo-lyase [Bacteroidetes bacterium]|nr:deoxyribodipyrimidine photo-lyase [Bacteroidota bacterium]
MKTPVSICWLRRDLRLDDNAALYYALCAGVPVLPLFIFDTEILDDLKDRQDRRVSFIYDTIAQLHEELKGMGSGMRAMHGKPLDCFKQLASEYDIAAVYTNNDYEPYAMARDKTVAEFLHEQNIAFRSYKDQVIFEKDEVVKDNGEPYNVYTPYSRKWKEKLNDFYLKSYPTEKYFQHFLQHRAMAIPTLKDIGFERAEYDVGEPKLNKEIAKDYGETRNFPAINGTTRLGVHLRFGTVSVRQLAREVQALNPQLLNELIWREFFQMILWHYPQVVTQSFRKEYDKIVWRNNEQEFEKWCKGETGFPIVDAGMRELNATGFMHNRVRMVVASFLTKDLLIDWRWGEAYFAEKLMDYDLASNNGNWQWAAGTGCDAAPYFRVFNPQLQAEKFDPNAEYIRKWVPEYESLEYIPPIVDHKAAKDRCIAAYKRALAEKG